MDGLLMKYFVLNPTSSDVQFAYASRIAMAEFAAVIEPSKPQLAAALREWVRQACAAET
jgi:hypothetical protein